MSTNANIRERNVNVPVIEERAVRWGLIQRAGAGLMLRTAVLVFGV